MTASALRSRSARSRTSQRDAGFTLVEMLVGTALFSAVLAMVAGMVISTIKESSNTRSSLANVDQLRQGLNAMTKTLRTAVRPEQLNPGCASACTSAFVAVGAESASFLANLGAVDATGRPTPTLVSYALTANPRDPRSESAVLTEVRRTALSRAAAGGFSFAGPCVVAGPAVAGCVARTVSDGIRYPLPTGEKLFAFSTLAGVPVSACGSSPDPCADIATVALSLPVGSATNAAPRVTAEVLLPNSSVGR